MKGWVVVDGAAQSFQELTRRDFPQARIVDQLPHGQRIVGLLEADDVATIEGRLIEDENLYGFGLYRDEAEARQVARALSRTEAAAT